jgi:hypothetical protein
MAKLPNKKEVKDTTVGVKNLGAALSELEKPLENVAKSFTQMLDKSKEILDNTKKIKKETEDENEENDKGNSLAEKAKKIFGDITDTLGLNLGLIKNIGGKGGALAAAGALALAFNANLTAIGEEFGAIGLQSKELTAGIMTSQVEVNKLGKGIADVLAVSKALTDEFGFGLSESIDLSASIVDTSVALGLGVDEGAKLVGVLSSVGGLSAETAQNFAKQVTSLSFANDVAPQAVLRDIAASSQTIALFTDGTAENIAKAAVQAKNLGLSLDSVAGAARQTLDFESSIAAEMTARAITGRNINLQKARELALTGNLEGFTKEILKQVGSQAEFNDLNVLQREKIAEATGFELENLTKLVNKQAEAVTLAGALAGQPGFEELVGEKGISTLTQLTGSLRSLGATLTNTLGPVLNIALQLLVSIGKAVEFVLSPLNALIGGTRFGTTAIPALANGGVTTGATLAQIGEAGPEAILPLDTFFTQMSSMMEKSNESVVNAIKEQKLQTRITNKQIEIVSTPANT